MSFTSDDLADIEQLLQAMENRLERRFDEFEKKVNDRFDENDEKMDERLDEILNAIGTDLNEKDQYINVHET